MRGTGPGGFLPRRWSLLLPLGLAVAAVLTQGCATMPRYESLPKTPRRPHTFYELDRRFVQVKVPGRERPVSLSYVEAGQGPPLVLIHGLMTSAYSFRYVIPALAKHYRVLVPDLPGAGQSESPVDLSMAPAQVAEVLAAFQEAVGAGRAYVVGNSLGGYLALWLWATHPERVERLVVMHSPGFPELRLHAMGWVLSLPNHMRLLRVVTRNPEQFVVNNVHYRDQTLMSQEEAAEYAAIFKNAARARVFARVLKESLSPAQMTALHRRLKEGRPGPQPVLLLWAKDDVLVSPDYGPRYQALIPGAELRWLDDCSHFMQVDAPEATVEALLTFGER